MKHIEYRNDTVKILAKRLDLRNSPNRYIGSMRYVPSSENLANKKNDSELPLIGRRKSSAADAVANVVQDLRLDDWWDPEIKLLIREMDPERPGLLTLSVRHQDFVQRIVDPLLGVMVHIHVRPLYSGGEDIQLVGYSCDYLAPEEDSVDGLGRLLVEVADVQGVPALGTQVHRINERPGWTWETDTAIARETGEPVILLRILVRGQPF